MIAFLKKYYWILISACIVLLDQVTKSIISATLSLYEEVPVIENFFAITHIHNEGIAFGMLSKFGNISKIIVAILTFVLIVVAIVFLCRGVIKHPFGIVTIAMIIGGGIGNLIDRIYLHYVIDFFAFTFFGKDFAIFNVADIFVTVGTFLFVVYFLIFERTNEERPLQDGTKGISDN